MTNEEAIWQLTKDKEYCMAHPIECGENAYKAYEMAIEALELVGKTDKLEKERDEAIEELRNIPNSCRFCKWYADESCTITNTCCVDDNPDHWEWRGVE